jgi:hypothetical protein
MSKVGWEKTRLLEGMKGFVSNVKACFKTMYLRQPIIVDILKYIRINEARGFSSMFASIDCMH